MGKAQPAPPPPTAQTSSLAVPAPPPPSLAIELPAKSSDPGIQKVLDQIEERKAKTADEIKNLTTEKMAFGMMRNVPRKDWNTPLTELGHWPRGSSVAEIKANPQLKNLTPAQAMLKLFEMSDAQKAKSGN